MVTLAKKGDLHARRQALAFIRDKDVVHKLFDEIKNRYLDRNGGYTKISKLRYRLGDAAPISVIELVGRKEEQKTKKKKGKAQEAMDKVKGLISGDKEPKEEAVSSECRSRHAGSADRCVVYSPNLKNEHRTSNVQHPTLNEKAINPRPKIRSRLGGISSSFPIPYSIFDVRRSMLDVYSFH